MPADNLNPPGIRTAGIPHGSRRRRQVQGLDQAHGLGSHQGASAARWVPGSTMSTSKRWSRFSPRQASRCITTTNWAATTLTTRKILRFGTLPRYLEEVEEVRRGLGPRQLRTLRTLMGRHPRDGVRPQLPATPSRPRHLEYDGRHQGLSETNRLAEAPAPARQTLSLERSRSKAGTTTRRNMKRS